ncbi:hypothetical protein CVT26_012360 [Gymnopilus dilepis]|uniref:NAD-dependent epimerase/dehydratase domain-containing protein n=1 Tax=Gymnopilus dilepis TaxID=231916 RepID=A0A409WDA4_9AGAR|nr:hypothetical protein CVT26_012360 [Gymnopilus dilepis]
MPTLQAGSHVLVTGANGYIGYWIVRKLLEQGYTVRAAVRSLAKGQPLKDYFSSYGDKLELIAVPDITRNGAFDEAVKGVDGIIHTATASDFSIVEPEDWIKPALDGTLSVLESAKNFGDKLQRLVITSSVVAAGFTDSPPTVRITEEDWNDLAVEITKSQGRDAPVMIKYTASKVLAEKGEHLYRANVLHADTAAWEFYNKHKNNLSWELVTILPSHVLGPALQPLQGPETLNVSLWLFYDAITNPQKSDEELKGTYNYIHVEDISQAHVAALQRAEAAGERIIVSAGAETFQGTRNLLRQLRPELYEAKVLPVGNTALDVTPAYIYNIEKGKKVLGLEYEKEAKILKDTVEFFESRGYFKKTISA